MKRLYAPWRHDYVTKVNHADKKKDNSEQSCVFCQQFQAQDDDKYFIIKRFTHCAAMMNYYPYNVGHLMILPYAHKADLSDLTPGVRAEMMEAVTISIVVMKKVLVTQGFNVGINLGIAGGGGIPSHLHIHVLPRWQGDTNFLETIGQTKLISANFMKTFQDLKDGFKDYKNIL